MKVEDIFLPSLDISCMMINQKFFLGMDNEPAKETSIVIIDDEKYVHDILKKIIELFRNNLRFETYTDSECALSFLNSSKTNLIFVDLNGETIMPFCYFRQALNSTINAQTPVVRISGNHELQQVDKEISDGFIAKPFNFEEVNNYVEMYL